MGALFLGVLSTCPPNMSVHVPEECHPSLLPLSPPPGSTNDQGHDDGVGDHHGELPASGQKCQLLPHGRVQPGDHAVRHRLPHR